MKKRGYLQVILRYLIIVSIQQTVKVQDISSGIYVVLLRTVKLSSDDQEDVAAIAREGLLVLKQVSKARVLQWH